MDASQLKRIPIFADVPDEDLGVITTFATSEEVPEGKVIVREGDFANQFMAIEEGTAKVTRNGEGIGELGPGDVFGEVGLIEKEKRTASVEATSRVRLIKIDHWELARMKKKLPEVYDRIAALANQRGPTHAVARAR
jgi:CRP/FNR family transcriptional regulator, cyclic AMP receptor protein